VKDLISHWATLGRPIIVFDLETTAWEGSLAANWSRPGEYREVVQIGAVRLTPDLSEVSDFSRYVRPVRNPVLSSYFTDLTGITQQMINARGTNFSTALHDFVDYVGAASAIVSNGTDGDVIVENCHLNGFACPLDTSLFRDVRKDISRALSIGDHETPSYMLPQLIGGQNTGRAHDGLSDARCIAAALRFIAARA
jgi:inhibitor of KinA sporulation pathway (predicted exonuclease)